MKKTVKVPKNLYVLLNLCGVAGTATSLKEAKIMQKDFYYLDDVEIRVYTPSKKTV